MKRFVNIGILAGFCLWIMPLGAFIKPINEPKTCGGKRAICLCSHSAKKAVKKTLPKLFLVHPSVNKEEASGSGHFLAEKLRSENLPQNSRLFDHEPNHYLLLLCQSIESVPKV